MTDDLDSRVYWAACSWRLQKTTDAVAPVAANPCTDDVDAANFLFGLKNATYDKHICAVGYVAGHCAGALFAGVCPRTCGETRAHICNFDNDAAAEALADL